MTRLQAREELEGLLASDELQNAALLVFANKSDMPGALATHELSAKLGLAKLTKQPWFDSFDSLQCLWDFSRLLRC